MSTYAENSKRIFVNTVMLYSRMFITMGVSLYTSRIVLQALGIEDFGIYNVVGGILTLMTFLNGALSTASSRFLTYELGSGGGVQDVTSAFRTNLTVHCLLSIFVFAIAQIFAVYYVNKCLVISPGRLYAANIVLQVTIVSSILLISLTPCTALVIAYENMSFYAYLGIWDAFYKLCLAYGLLHSPYDHLILYSILLLLGTLIQVLIYHIYCKKKYQVYTLRFLFEKNRFKSLLSFTSWGLLGSSSLALKTQGVNLLLNSFYGPVVNAAWGISYQINNAISSFNQNFIIAMNPQIIKTYAASQFEITNALVYRGARLSIYLIQLISLPILLQVEYVLEIWLVEVPKYAVHFTQLVLVNTIVESVTYTLGAVIQASGRIKKYQLCVSGVLLFNLPISYLALNGGFEPYVVLFISIFLSVIGVFIRLFFIQALLKVNYFYFLYNILLKPILIACLTFLIVSLVNAYIGLAQASLSFVFTTCLCLFIYTLVVILQGLSAEERALCVQFFKKKYGNYA